MKEKEIVKEYLKKKGKSKLIGTKKKKYEEKSAMNTTSDYPSYAIYSSIILVNDMYLHESKMWRYFYRNYRNQSLG